MVSLITVRARPNDGSNSPHPTKCLGEKSAAGRHVISALRDGLCGVRECIWRGRFALRKMGDGGVGCVGRRVDGSTRQ
jgi:hypothetical protein